MKSFVRALGFAAVLLPASSFAGVYLGASGLVAERAEYSNVDDAFGGKASLGYRFEQLPIMLEASYIDTGKADIDDDYYGDGTAQFTGSTVGLAYFWTLSSRASGFWVRGEWYHGETEVKFYGGSGKESGDGAGLAFGGIWKVNDWFGLRAEYEVLFAPKDFDRDANLGMFSTGIVLEFGHASEPASPRAANVDRGYVAAPAGVASVSEQPAAAPTAAFVSPAAAQQQNALRASQNLEIRTQPRLEASVVVAIPNGAEYQRLQGFHNKDGDWGFVQYDGRSGWLFEGTR